MQVFQTAGDPPNCGSTILAIIGCTQNSRNAPRKAVVANKSVIGDSPLLGTRQRSLPLGAAVGVRPHVGPDGGQPSPLTRRRVLHHRESSAQTKESGSSPVQQGILSQDHATIEEFRGLMRATRRAKPGWMNPIPVDLRFGC